MNTTRRAFLATMPAAVLAPLRSAEPDFERIDTHTHIHRTIPALLAAMENARWKALSICDSRELGDEPSTLPEMTRGTIEAVRQSRGRLAWAATFDARGSNGAGGQGWYLVQWRNVGANTATVAGWTWTSQPAP